MRNIILKIALCGNEKVGKTAIAKQYSENTFLDTYKMTIGSDFITKEIRVSNFPVTLQIWDFGGSDRFAELRPMYYKGLKGVVMIFDLSNRQSFEQLDNWFNELKPDSIGAKYIIIGNKSDLPERQVTYEEASQYALKRDTDYFEISAKTGENIAQVFAVLAEKIVGVVIEAQKPSVPTVEPITTTPEPVTTTPEPVSTTPEPPPITSEPVTATLEPVSSAPEPPPITSEPVTATPEPVSTTPEPPPITSEPVTATPESIPTTTETVITPTETPIESEPTNIVKEIPSIISTSEEKVEISALKTEVSQTPVSSPPEIPLQPETVSMTSQTETIAQKTKNNLDGLMILAIKSDYQSLNDTLSSINNIESENEKETALRLLKMLIKKGESEGLDENSKYLIIQARISLNYLLSNYFIENSQNNQAAEHFLKIAHDMWLLDQPIDTTIEYFIIASSLSLTYNSQLLKRFFETQDKFFKWLNEQGDVRFKLIRSLFRVNTNQDDSLLNEVIEIFRSNRVRFSENIQYYLDMAIDRLKSVLSRFRI
ncbi:MAG: GTP-binding protein [Promethearchaeota archaeon]